MALSGTHSPCTYRTHQQVNAEGGTSSLVQYVSKEGARPSVSCSRHSHFCLAALQNTTATSEEFLKGTLSAEQKGFYHHIFDCQGGFKVWDAAHDLLRQTGTFLSSALLRHTLCMRQTSQDGQKRN